MGNIGIMQGGLAGDGVDEKAEIRGLTDLTVLLWVGKSNRRTLVVSSSVGLNALRIGSATGFSCMQRGACASRWHC